MQQDVALRQVEDDDLDLLFDQMRDPAAVRMAAFTAQNPDDRAAFDAHLARLRTAPDVTLRAVTRDGRLVGSIASFVAGGRTEVTYWIDRPFWGIGIATAALALLLGEVTDRPVYARVASDNAGSLALLGHAGFTVIDSDIGWAPGRAAAIGELVLCLK